jgi:DNA-binding CsgD family transcriptional regulator
LAAFIVAEQDRRLAVGELERRHARAVLLAGTIEVLDHGTVLAAIDPGVASTELEPGQALVALDGCDGGDGGIDVEAVEDGGLLDDARSCKRAQDWRQSHRCRDPGAPRRPPAPPCTAWSTSLPPRATELDLDDLTTREREVLELIAQGLDNSRIAKDLGLGEKTVRNYVSAVLAKLGFQSRAEAIVRTREAGLGRKPA